MRPISLLAASAIAVVCASPGPAFASGPGLRFGLSVDPDQVYFGIHQNFGDVTRGLSFVPNVEVGLGDDLTLFAFNAEFTHSLGRSSAWRPYIGAGPALNLVSRDGDSEVEAGLNVLLGLRRRGGFFVELKVGAFDSPEFKLGAGFSF